MEVEGAFATLRRRGSPEAGAIFVIVDRLDGQVALFAPAPSDDKWEGERRWARAHKGDWVTPGEVAAKLEREIRNDPDLWCVEIESRDGRHWLDLADD